MTSNLIRLTAIALLAAPGAALAEPAAAPAEILGIPIEGDVLFVIDASETMDEAYGLHSRLSVAAEAVAAAVEALPPDRKFNFAAFDSGIHWIDGFYRLVPATRANKDILLSALENLETGEGSSYEIALALPVVFAPRPKQVILITGGQPENFDHVDEIQALVDLGVRVDCVGLGLNRRGISQLREIAHPAGGTVVYADEPQPVEPIPKPLPASAGIE